MAKAARQGKQEKQLRQAKRSLKYEIIGLGLVVLACLSLVSLYSQHPGTVGGWFQRVLSSLAGSGRVMIPLMLIFVGLQVMNRKHYTTLNLRTGAAFGLFLLALAFLHLQLDGMDVMKRQDIFSLGHQGKGGGLIGAVLAYGLTRAFGMLGSTVVLVGLTVCCLMLLTNMSVVEASKLGWQKAKQLSAWLRNQLGEFLFVVVEDQEAVPIRLPKPAREKEKQDAKGVKVSDPIIRNIPLIINGAEFKGTPGGEDDLPETLFPEIKPVQDLESEMPKAKVKAQDQVGTVTGTPLSRQVARESLHDYLLPPINLLQRSLKVKNT
ncbi:MAG TPA: DNA translocase FtsK 4TM domain-containing protein, partial [Verrucomicrobiae bacterium]|nr:DNA translocase FtsK 4TM domain-containing protein [Verrucomicrobiae bacterium]